MNSKYNFNIHNITDIIAVIESFCSVTFDIEEDVDKSLNNTNRLFNDNQDKPDSKRSYEYNTIEKNIQEIEHALLQNNNDK